MDGSEKAGWRPISAYTTNAPITEERTTRPRKRLFRSPTISSMTKAIAASGALKAAASPAEAPMTAAPLRPRLGVPKTPSALDATPLPMNTDGPSRPRLLPPPMLNIPATNFIRTGVIFI